jgi:hypothetical protein
MKSLKLCVFIFILIVLVIPNSFASNTVPEKWHFTGDQQPYYAKLQSSDADEFKDGCVAWVNNMYKNYALLYPAFKPSMKDEKWRKKWRRSMILRGHGEIRSQNICFYRILLKRMMALPYASPRRILFCGVITDGIGDKELKSAKAAEELFEYAMNKRFSAFHMVLNWESGSSPIKHNADVKYYLQLMINKHWPMGDNLHANLKRYLVPDASEGLSVVRKKFVEKAHGRGDYKAVLATTEPCKQ